jgi:dTDP-4-amino-4,6-dideoxygalactose transaminase
MSQRIYLSPPDTGKAEKQALANVLDSGWVAPAGPEITLFEQDLAQLCQREAAVATVSGTAALHLALLSLGIGKGDLVLCPTFTFAATANPIFYCGATAEFLDSDATTWNLCPQLLEARLSASAAGKAAAVKAVIACSIYGNCVGMAAIEAICQRFGVPLIEDAAEALGATADGRAAGSFGDFSLVSFNGNKIITTSGGGVLLGKTGAAIEQARYLASQAREPVRHYEHKAIGYNYRMSNVLAALGRAQLRSLPERITRRKQHFQFYRDAFDSTPDWQAMPAAQWQDCNYWLSCFLVKDTDQREYILDLLEAANIEARPLWKPLHLQPAYQQIKTHGGVVAATLFARGICLPSGSGMSDAQRARVVGIVSAAVRDFSYFRIV